MTYTPFVSVIVPNYNYAQYLKQRMETILNQTYQNFEVIILDDCSTDNSLEIIEKYRLHSNVREVIVNEHNSGTTKSKRTLFMDASRVLCSYREFIYAEKY